VKPDRSRCLENCRVNKGRRRTTRPWPEKWRHLRRLRNDAFGTAHRAEATTYGIARFWRRSPLAPGRYASGAGGLGKALTAPRRPLVAISLPVPRSPLSPAILGELGEKSGPAEIVAAASPIFSCWPRVLPVRKSRVEADWSARRKDHRTIKGESAGPCRPSGLGCGAKDYPSRPRATVKDAGDVAAVTLDPRHRPKTAVSFADALRKGRTIVSERSGGRVRVRPIRRGTKTIAHRSRLSPILDRAGGGGLGSQRSRSTG